MSPDLLFAIANPAASIGWVALLASPWMPVLAQRMAGLVVPAVLGIAYAGLMVAFGAGSTGGFDTLANVARLFETRELLLAGWLHYLAFDLLVGAWIARTARAEQVPFWLVVPCLALTFLLGPIGFLAFTLVRALRLRIARAAAT